MTGRRCLPRAQARGKPPKLSARQQAHLVQLHGAGEHFHRRPGEMFSVSRATVYRTLDRAMTRTPGIVKIGN